MLNFLFLVYYKGYSSGTAKGKKYVEQCMGMGVLGALAQQSESSLNPEHGFIT
jgi:hypothetical protein